MEAQDATQLLAQLRDIHLPPAPAEPAVWPLVVAALIIAVAATVLVLRHLQQSNSWAATATRELKQIQTNAEAAAPLKTAELLKRIVITHDKNPDVRHLSGNAWLVYLDKFFSTQFFTTGHGQLFGDTLYQPRQNNQPLKPEIYTTLRKLIRRRKWRDD